MSDFEFNTIDKLAERQSILEMELISHAKDPQPWAERDILLKVVCNKDLSENGIMNESY